MGGHRNSRPLYPREGDPVPTALGAGWAPGGRQRRGCIIPQAVTHSLVLLKMGKIIARNMLS